MIEQALRVANTLGLPPDQTARLIATAEQRRRAPRVLIVDEVEYKIGLMGRGSAPPLVLPVECMAFRDRPRGARRGQRRGCNSWD